ncbi:MAG: SDR family oxidoreductase [Bacilli bacterium]
MKVLITGASSGIGLDMAKYLSSMGHELILVARDKDRLEEIQRSLKTKTKIIIMDLAIESNVKSLYVLCKNDNIDMLINNAGFGICGEFTETEINRELEMMDLNMKAVYILTKMFLTQMESRGGGYILNVASSAAFTPGPLMAIYYATKAYVLRLTEAIYYELKKTKSKVVISCLCPGPVATNFNKVANVSFSIKPLTSEYVAKYAIDQMLYKHKLVIIPGLKMKLLHFLEHFVSDKTQMHFAYKIQHKKLNSRIDK